MHTPRTRLAGEFAFVLALLAFSLFMLWTAYGISRFESLTSAGAFPMFTTLVMVASGAVVAARTRRLPAAEAAPGESTGARFVRQLAPPVIVGFTAAIAVYMLLLERLGFLVASYLFLAGSMRLLGSRRWGLNLVVAAVALAAIYAVFQTVFSVVLPTGTWLRGVWK